jgi:hypothetical protein
MPFFVSMTGSAPRSYQHAEHYCRVNNERRDGNSEGTSQPIDRGVAHIDFVVEPSETSLIDERNFNRLE